MIQREERHGMMMSSLETEIMRFETEIKRWRKEYSRKLLMRLMHVTFMDSFIAVTVAEVALRRIVNPPFY